MSKIQLKVHEKKRVHEEIEEHHKKVEHITKEAHKILKKYRDRKELKSRSIGKEEIMHFTAEGDVKRVPTGIKGLDELIEGGLPERSVTLLTGACGTGKSVFGMEFLVNGATRGEPGVYISLQESMEETLNQMRFFGWPVDELVKEGKLLIVQPELYNFDALLTTIEDAIDKIKAKRMVIDSISIIGMYFEEPFKIRKSLLDLGQLLKKLGCTTIAISEVSEDKKELSPYGVEEFVVDAVIILYYIKKTNMFIRAIAIRKMRTTKHSNKIHPIKIRRHGGIIIYPSEEIFTDI
jgi:KaiC/GvpD/RAD55 family RecA-like ATPase